jgi:AraC-like DNA-binding protein
MSGLSRANARSEAISLRLAAVRVAPFEASFEPVAGETTPWRLSFHERGRAALASPSRVQSLPPGRAILIGPDIGVFAKPEGDAQHLLVEWSFARARDAAAVPARGAPLVLDGDGTRDELARALLRELATGTPASAGACARAQALVHLCLASVIEASAERDSGRDESTQLQPVLRYIDAHLADLLPNSKLAELAHASESHFIRMFRRALGRTPARHVQERRVSLAAELLLRTSLSIDEIAERCGFANRYHFSRVFAQRMSHPPARFRALHLSRAPRSEPRAEDTPAYGNF